MFEPHALNRKYDKILPVRGDFERRFHGDVQRMIAAQNSKGFQWI
jgi:hypothetical protein